MLEQVPQQGQRNRFLQHLVHSALEALIHVNLLRLPGLGAHHQLVAEGLDSLPEKEVADEIGGRVAVQKGHVAVHQHDVVEALAPHEVLCHEAEGFEAVVARVDLAEVHFEGEEEQRLNGLDVVDLVVHQQDPLSLGVQVHLRVLEQVAHALDHPRGTVPRQRYKDLVGPGHFFLAELVQLLRKLVVDLRGDFVCVSAVFRILN